MFLCVLGSCENCHPFVCERIDNKLIMTKRRKWSTYTPVSAEDIVKEYQLHSTEIFPLRGRIFIKNFLLTFRQISLSFYLFIYFCT